MPHTNLFLTRSPVVFSAVVAVLLGVVVWLGSCHFSATTAEDITPTAIPASRSAGPATVVLPPAAPVTDTRSGGTALSCGRASFATTPEIVLGALAPLSKPGAMQSGFAMQTAFNLAVDEINAQGGIQGKRLRLIAYDTAGLPEQGVHAAERLIVEDCAVALVGVYHSRVAIAIKDVVKRLGVPIIFVDPYADEVTADQTPAVFRIAPTTSLLAQIPGQWLAEVGDYNQDGEKMAVVLAENSTYGSARIEHAQKWLPQAGFAIEPLLVNIPITDDNAVIARIVALDHMPDALFLNLSGDTAYDLTQSLISAGIGPQKSTLLVINSNSRDDQTFWQHVPDGAYTVVPYIGPWPATINGQGQRFADHYRTYFDHWPEAYAFAAYDSVFLIADAISRTQSLEPAALITALEQTDIELAAGHYTFPYNAQNPPDGTTIPAYMWHQWPNPPLYYLQYTEPQQALANATIIWPPTARTSPAAIVRAEDQAP